MAVRVIDLVRGQSQQDIVRRCDHVETFRADNGDSNEILTIPEPFAFLDIAWSPHVPNILAACTSTGQLVFYRITQHSIDRVIDVRVCDPKTLVLDLEFDTANPGSIGVTLSDGRVCLIRLEPGLLSALVTPAVGHETAKENLYQVQDLDTHSLEAWTLAFAQSPARGVYSGGDDAILHFESRPVEETSEIQISSWKDSKIHGAGITALLELHHPPPSNGNLVTGSYDDHVRIVQPPGTPFGSDRRRRPAVLAELNLGGGVWRLELIKRIERTHFLLASCMHAGCKIVAISETRENASEPAERQSDDTWNIRVVAEFEEHKSMNYASCVHDVSGRLVRIVSTSFYDKLMCLWECELR